MIAQPMLYIPPDIELGLLNGSLKLFGSVVREADTGRIFKHLDYIIPTPEQVEKAVKSARLNAKLVISVVAVTAVAGAGVTFLVKRRKKTELMVPEVLPQCVTDFEASLRAYIEAGRNGELNAEVIQKLTRDLDAIKEFSGEGNEVKISLDELVPLFDLVIAHTPKLAEAYAIELDNFEEPGADLEDSVVVTLRRHLVAQRSILTEVA